MFTSEVHVCLLLSAGPGSGHLSQRAVHSAHTPPCLSQEAAAAKNQYCTDKTVLINMNEAAWKRDPFETRGAEIKPFLQRL